MSAPADDMADHMRRRGALQVAIRAPLGDDGRLVNAAAWRLPEGSHVIERMHARGQLNDPDHATASALLACWQASGLAASMIGGYAPRAAGGVREPSAGEDAWHDAMLRAGMHAGLVREVIVEGWHPGWRTPLFQEAMVALAWICVEFDGLPWSDDRS